MIFVSKTLIKQKKYYIYYRLFPLNDDKIILFVRSEIYSKDGQGFIFKARYSNVSLEKANQHLEKLVENLDVDSESELD